MVENLGGHYRPAFQSHQGVTQGYPLSPTIFNVVIVAIIEIGIRLWGASRRYPYRRACAPSVEFFPHRRHSIRRNQSQLCVGADWIVSDGGWLLRRWSNRWGRYSHHMGRRCWWYLHSITWDAFFHPPTTTIHLCRRICDRHR